MLLPENGGTSIDHCQEEGGDGFIHEGNRSSSESESDSGMSHHPCMHAEEILNSSDTNLTLVSYGCDAITFTQSIKEFLVIMYATF